MQYDKTWVSTVCLLNQSKNEHSRMILKNQTGPTAKIRVLPSIFGKGQKGSLSCSTAIMAPLLSVLLQPPFSALTALMSPLHWRKIVFGKNHTANEVIYVIIVSARKAAQKGLWGHRCQQEPKAEIQQSWYFSGIPGPDSHCSMRKYENNPSLFRNFSMIFIDK